GRGWGAGGAAGRAASAPAAARTRHCAIQDALRDRLRDPHRRALVDRGAALRPPAHDGAGRRWVPRAPWIGITRGRTGELILASADQTVVVPDVGARRVIARFPATVSSSSRVETDECSPLAAGRDG